MAGQGISTHIGDHQRKDKAVAPGHLEDDEDRGHGRTNDAGKDRAHAHQGKRADRLERMMKDGDVKMTDDSAEHASNEQRGGKDSASSAAAVGKNGSRKF